MKILISYSHIDYSHWLLHLPFISGNWNVIVCLSESALQTVLETSCVSVSPGDRDAARKRWTGSICHLWRKGNPFLVLPQWKASHSYLDFSPVVAIVPPSHLQYATNPSSSPFPLMSCIISTIISVLHAILSFTPLVHVPPLFSINVLTLRDTKLAKMNG